MPEFLDFWKHYADFKGRTTIRGFWIALLFWYLLAAIVLVCLLIFSIAALHYEPERAIEFSRFCLLCGYGHTVIPLLSLTVRRLRDAGYSAKNLFWLLIPGIGAIVFLVRLCSESKTE